MMLDMQFALMGQEIILNIVIIDNTSCFICLKTERYMKIDYGSWNVVYPTHGTSL